MYCQYFICVSFVDVFYIAIVLTPKTEIKGIRIVVRIYLNDIIQSKKISIITQFDANARLISGETAFDETLSPNTGRPPDPERRRYQDRRHSSITRPLPITASSRA